MVYVYRVLTDRKMNVCISHHMYVGTKRLSSSRPSSCVFRRHCSRGFTVYKSLVKRHRDDNETTREQETPYIK